MLVGALIAFMQKSGGIDGFIKYMSKIISDDEKELKRNRIKVQLMAAVTGVLIFVESNISALTVGTVFRPIFDKLKISEKSLLILLILHRPHLNCCFHLMDGAHILWGSWQYKELTTHLEN